MAQRRYYRVAGHLFSVTAEESLFAQMTHYAPFRTDDADADTLFDLTVGEVDVPATKEHVFTDVSDEDMPRIEIYRVAQDWLFLLAPTKTSETCMSLLTSENMRQAQLSFTADTDRFSMDNACMLLYAFTSVWHRTLLLHASAIEWHNAAYLFLGKSGTGKSTHARLWQESFADARLLNDDNPVLRLLDNGEIRAYGSPWSGKTPCYLNRDARVGALVQLQQAPSNQIRALRLPEAYAAVLASASGLKIVPAMMDALYGTISDLIRAIQVFHLDCLPNSDAAQLCAHTIEAK